MPTPSPADVDVLIALANAIVPPDHRDAGANAVDAGPRLAERMSLGVHGTLYEDGLRMARELSARAFGRGIGELGPSELHDLMLQVRDAAPAFFKQLRFDVTTLYLSDPGVWKRIGFPGPSIETGGHPDFDQPQGTHRSES